MNTRTPAASSASPKLTHAIAGWALLERVGEGASGVVFRAVHANGTVAALKVGRVGEPWIDREAATLARARRRWGPALLASGRVGRRVHAPGGDLAAAAPWIATTWIDGAPLSARHAGVDDPRALAATIAHGVGRGLDELHGSGVRHGDVKPANILIGRARPRVDRASDRGAVLVDLDLAEEIASGALAGGTPRYLAPELRAGGAATPAADLYALGLVLAETIAPELADDAELDPPRIVAAVRPHDRELAGWVEALTAPAPGARPSAAWVADQAARMLGLRADDEEVREARRARVRRAYLAVRAPRLAPASCIDPLIDEPARGWLDDARSLLLAPNDAVVGDVTTPPLDALGRSRWLLALVGPAAASWPIPEGSEGVLASRLLALADVAAPEAWTVDDVVRGTPGGEEARAPRAAARACADSVVTAARARRAHAGSGRARSRRAGARGRPRARGDGDRSLTRAPPRG